MSESRSRSPSRSRSRRRDDDDDDKGDSKMKTDGEKGGDGGKKRADDGGDRRKELKERAGEPSRVVGAFGLAMATKDLDLKREFSKYGNLEKVNLIIDKETLKSRGFAFIYYKDEGSATKAVEACKDLVLDGRKVRVDFSLTKKPHDPTPGRYMGELTDRQKRDRELMRRQMDGGGRGRRSRSPPRGRGADEECFQFRYKGHCQYGVTCKFSHGDAAGRGSRRSRSPRPSSSRRHRSRSRSRDRRRSSRDRSRSRDRGGRRHRSRSRSRSRSPRPSKSKRRSRSRSRSPRPSKDRKRSRSRSRSSKRRRSR